MNEEEVITIKQYASKRNISYESVRSQVSRYKKTHLKGHISIQNRTQYLDQYAINFLDKKRRENPITVIHMETNDEVNRLRNENKMLLQKIAELQDLLIHEKDAVKALQADKITVLEQNKGNTEKAPETQEKRHWWKSWL